jgi:molybdate transport system permease protein
MRLTLISIVLSLSALIASEFLSRHIAARVGAA